MSSDPLVSNSYVSSNPDIPVRATEVAGGPVIQHMRIDFGSGSAESVVTSANPLPVSATFSGTIDSSGVIVDGVDDTIKATVRDYANSNPLAVSLTDTSGDAITGFPVTGTVTANLGTISTAATAAKQDSQTTLLTTIDADTGNIATSAATIAGAVSGTEMQVDVLTMPTVTVQATDLDIRDLTSATDSVGAVQSGTWNITNISGTVSLPTDAATATNQATELTRLQEISDNTATTSPIGDTVVSDGGSGSFAVKVAGHDGTNSQFIKTDTDGELQVDVLSLPAISGSVTVSGSVTANAGTNLNTSALALETTLSTLNGKVTACNTGAVTISAALPAGTNAIGKLAANSGIDIGDVDVLSCALPSGASTLAEQQTQTTALQLIDNVIAVHDSAATTSLAQIGGKAYAASALPSAVTANDAVITTHDLQGRLVTAPHTGVPLHAYLALTSNAENTIIAAPGAGSSIYITSITCTASGGAGIFVFRKGTGGSIFVTLGVPGTTSMGHICPPTPYKVGDNTLVSVAPTVATATQTSITYYIAAS